MTTAAPTTLATTDPDQDIIVSPISIVVSTVWSSIIVAPEVFQYTYNPYLNTYIYNTDKPIEITLSVEETSFDNVGILVELVTVSVGIIHTRVDVGKIVITDPVEVVIGILTGGSEDVNNFSITIGDISGKTNFVRWSKIGHVDFTVDESNIAGERPMDFSGYVHRIMKLGSRVIVYGENGVSAMSPNGVAYGLAKILPRGTKGRYAMAGDEFRQFFIDDLGNLYRLDEQLTKLDFSEYLSPMSNPVMTYDQERQVIYITDDTYGYVYGIDDNSLGVGPINITGYGYKSGVEYVVAPTTIDTPNFGICTDIYDFGTRKFKTITALEIGTDMSQKLYSSIEYRTKYSDEFKQLQWFLVNPNGKTYPKCYGVEFRIKLATFNYEYFEIDYIKVRGIIHGYSYLDEVV